MFEVIGGALFFGLPAGLWLGLLVARGKISHYKRELNQAQKVIEAGLFPADKSLQERVDEAQAAEDRARRMKNAAEAEVQRVQAIKESIPIPPSQDPSPPQFYGDGSIRTPNHIKSLPDWEREALAIERAKRGLPPNDALDGLAYWSVTAIEKARMQMHKNS